MGQGPLPTQLPGTQDHRVEVTFQIEGSLKTTAQVVGGEGKGGTRIHGLGPEGSGASDRIPGRRSSPAACSGPPPRP